MKRQYYYNILHGNTMRPTDRGKGTERNDKKGCGIPKY